MAHAVPTMPVALDVSTLAQFVDPLPVPEIVSPQGRRPSPNEAKQSVPFCRIQAQVIATKFHRDLAAHQVLELRPFDARSDVRDPRRRSATGGMGECAAQPTFLADRPHDPGAEDDKAAVRTVVHLHGAKTGPESDGYPEDWIAPGRSSLCYYPNQQEAAMLWYHDHAIGINRLNIYAGLFGAFFIRDGVEEALNLPKGKYELPLLLYDRLLTRDGQLLYPVSPNPESPWVPEVFGNAILVNGKLFPYLEVEPRSYRVRLLNASNARSYHLSFANQARFHQIGTDRGLLPAPVPLTELEISPGERADLVIDFSEHRGTQLVLKNDAFVVMQFRVFSGKTTETSSLPAALRPVRKIPESEAVATRMLTERPVLGSTEIWTLINPTNDSHPIHLHLVRFQILDRQPYEPWLFQTKRKLHFKRAARRPEPNEAGWKDTVRAYSRMVTRIIVPFEGFTRRYVWHCQILQHEDNEMMRP